MASAVYIVLANHLDRRGGALAANFGRAAERVVGVLARRSEDASERVRRWRVLGMIFTLAGVLLLVIAQLSR
jgi:hypothetical protein